MIKQVLTFSDGIQHLHASGEVLLVAHHGGVTAFDPKSGAARKWTTRDGLPAHPAVHIASEGKRIAVATPNGVAWSDDAPGLLRDGFAGRNGHTWQRALAHPLGAGAYVNGLAFVQGRIWAAAGGGRIYREGERGFELLELPIRQARLVRLLPLASSKGLRVLIVTNNNGVLLVATGGGEPSLYQWSEDAGLMSRYATAGAVIGDFVAIAVHGGVHVATLRSLTEKPDSLERWGTIRVAETAFAGEQNRISTLCEHAGYLYAGGQGGLHRVPTSDLALAAKDVVTAEQIDDVTVRHLASVRGELWIAQQSTLGRFADAPERPHEPHAEDGPPTPSRRWMRPPGIAGLQDVGIAPPSLRRSRFVADSRWCAAPEPGQRQVLALAASPESLAVGGESGRVSISQNGRWSHEIVARMRRSPDVHALAWDAENGVFWAATRAALYYREDRGRWRRDLEFPGRTVYSLCAWGGSTVALGNAGLHLFVQNRWAAVDFGAVQAPPLFVAAATDSVLALAGRAQAGVWIWRTGAARPELAAIPIGRVNCMAWGEGDNLWLGLDRGVVRWDGHRTASFVWNDERRDRVAALVEYGGRLFVGSQAGLFVAPVRNLRESSGEALEAQGERIGLLQGLPDPHVTRLLLHDSTIWVGTQGGLALWE